MQSESGMMERTPSVENPLASANNSLSYGQHSRESTESDAHQFMNFRDVKSAVLSCMERAWSGYDDILTRIDCLE